jgi:hypothetical protein
VAGVRFSALARSGRTAASLSEATEGDLDRSLRLAEGVRRAILLQALPTECDPRDDGPGIVLLAGDNSISGADAAGERWIVVTFEPIRPH